MRCSRGVGPAGATGLESPGNHKALCCLRSSDPDLLETYETTILCNHKSASETLCKCFVGGSPMMARIYFLSVKTLYTDTLYNSKLLNNRLV